MGKEQTKDLLKFLEPFDNNIKEIVLWLRDFIWESYPKANELIYDNYNALAIGWSLTEKVGHTFCSIAVGRTSFNIHFGFYWGAELDDPEKRLLGQGNQYRYILVKSKNEFPKDYIIQMMQKAYANSLKKVKNKSELVEGLTITKSISDKKRKTKDK
jgi:hypothetical protein